MYPAHVFTNPRRALVLGTGAVAVMLLLYLALRDPPAGGGAGSGAADSMLANWAGATCATSEALWISAMEKGDVKGFCDPLYAGLLGLLAAKFN